MLVHVASIRQVVRKDGKDVTGWTPQIGRERRLRPPIRGTWEVTVSLGRDPAGKYRKQTRRLVGTFTEAKELGQRMDVEAQGRRPNKERVTLDEAILAYLEQRKAQGRAPKTLVGYESIARRLRGVLVADNPVTSIRLTKLTAGDLDAAYRALLTELQPASVHHHHAFVSQVLNQAVKWEWITSPTAADRASPPPLEQPDPDPPSLEDVRWLINEFRVEGDDLPAFCYLAAQTGCRRGEVCGWTFDTLDVAGARLRVMASISDAGGHVIRRRTKTKKGRPMALSPDAALVAAYLWDRYVDRCRLLDIEPDRGAYVFSQEPDHSKPWRPDRVTHTFGRARQRAATRLLRAMIAEGATHQAASVAFDRVMSIKLKDLRSLSATVLLGSGVDVKTAAARMGHDASVMLRHYAGVLKANDEAAAELLGAAIGSAELVLPPTT